MPQAKDQWVLTLEYVLLQRAALGCKIDGGQHKMGSSTHPDAEVIAATVAGMPDKLGGIRMATQVAELARAGMTPDWMPGVIPRCVPMEKKTNQHGERATTIDQQRAEDRKADADRLERIETDIRAMRDVMFEAFQRGRTD